VNLKLNFQELLQMNAGRLLAEEYCIAHIIISFVQSMIFHLARRYKMLLVINNPDIIFMDEPLSGLDANAVILVKNLLTNLAKDGKTIFYCSHLMDIVEKISDRIILINNGVVVADGTFEELRTEKADTLEMLFSQLTGRQENLISTDDLFNGFREN